MAELTLDKTRTAVIMADFHADTMTDNPHVIQRNVLENSRKVLDAAREVGILVVFIVVAFRDGLPEVHPRNKAFGPRRLAGERGGGDPVARIHPAVAPLTTEPVVVKHRVGPFLGTDFEMVLRSNNIESLVLLGHATSGVILSTVRYAADADYELVVLEDCCADRDPEVHDFLIQRLFPRQATIARSEDFVGSISGR